VDKGWFNDSHAVHLWMYLILKASHSKREVLWNGKIIYINAGQFITGRKKMSADTGIQESKIERLLKLFESEQQIEQQMTNTSRLISIINYVKFQTSEQQVEQRMNNKRTTDEQRVNTKQELKNLKNKELKNDLNIPANAGGDVNSFDGFDLNDLKNENEGGGGEVPNAKESAPKRTATPKKEKQTNTDPAFKECMQIYADFYVQFDRPLRITPADAKGLKEILNYISTMPNVKDGKSKVSDAFKFILDNWHKLDKWQQTQTELRQINSRITNIIQQLKNNYGQAKSTHPHEQELHDYIANLRKGMANG